MKILLLDHPQFTHSTWMLYEGLVRVLGRDSVTLFPSKPLFDGKYPSVVMKLMDIRWYRDVYKNLQNLPAGIPPLSSGESLTANDERVQLFAFCPVPPSTDKTDQISIDEDEVIELLNLNHYDLIVLGNSHRVPTIALARLRDRCKSLPPIIYFDAGERDEFNAHWWHVFRPALVFKSTVTPEVMSKIGSPAVPCELFPMPLSHPTVLCKDNIEYQLEDSDFRNRDIHLVSSFGPTWPMREIVQQRVEQVCSQMSITSNKQFNAILSGYSSGQLSQSKIAVSMRGSGRDTERYWEMPARGAAMIADGTMGCVHPFPFRSDEHAVFYRNLEELESSILCLINDDEKRISIAKAGHEHIKRFHSIEGRTLFFLGIIKQQIGINYTDIQSARLERWYTELGWDSYLPDWKGPVVGYDE